MGGGENSLKTQQDIIREKTRKRYIEVLRAQKQQGKDASKPIIYSGGGGELEYYAYRGKIQTDGVRRRNLRLRIKDADGSVVSDQTRDVNTGKPLKTPNDTIYKR